MLEIGFGARPLRMIALQRLGVEANGVDMDVPLLEGRPRELAKMVRTNGIERLAKTLVRGLLFDRRERRLLDGELECRGARAPIHPERFLIADAAELDLPRGSVDLIVSEDVFEHVRPASLERLLPKMAEWLGAPGIAVITPNAFPGITGGHQTEWGRLSFLQGASGRESPPWDHLR